MRLWDIANKIDITRKIDNFVIKYFSFDKKSRRIDFTIEEAWRVFRYAVEQPSWNDYVKASKIVFGIFTLFGLPYMIITIIIKLIMG